MRPAIQFSCRVTALILAMLWLCQTPLSAAIYKWKDDQGKIHFTDDKSRIPLKYRMQLEKFRGVTEPKPKEEPPAEDEAPLGEGQGDLKSGQEPQAASPPPPPKEEAKPQPQYTEEELAQLKETHDFLVATRDRNFNLINRRRFTRSIGELYVKIAPQLADSKTKMARKIRGATVPSLKEARIFLKKSRFKDMQEEKLAKTGYEGRLEKLKKRLENSVLQMNKIIDKIKTDLGMELEPHPTLADAAQDKSNKKSRR